MDEVVTATCARCTKPKPLNEFHRDRRRPNGVTAQCKACRLALAQSKTYPVACLECARHRRLDSNGCCSKCNRARGLRECRDCITTLLILVCFYRGRAVCKDCLKLRRERERGNILPGPESDSTGGKESSGRAGVGRLAP